MIYIVIAILSLILIHVMWYMKEDKPEDMREYSFALSTAMILASLAWPLVIIAVMTHEIVMLVKKARS